MLSPKLGNVIHREGVNAPWKSNGSIIDPNASLDDWRKQAGLDYDVLSTPSLYKFGDELKSVPNRVQLIRSDTGESLSEVSANNYKVRQPKEIVEFFRNLVESNNMQMDLLGSMQGGRKIFGLASTGADAEIGKGSGDIVKANVFLIESFDCSHATKARSGAERLFCLNQIETNYRSGSGYANKNAIKRKHSQDFIPEDVQFELAHVNDNFVKFVEFANAMAKEKVTKDFVIAFLARLYAPEAFGEDFDLSNWRKAKKIDFNPVSKNKQNVIAAVFEVLEDNLGYALEGTHGTLWGLLNAVTFYHDHEARTKGTKRWESAMIGNGNAMKNQARDIAREVIDLKPIKVETVSKSKELVTV